MLTAELVGDARWFAGVHVVVDGRVLLTVGGEHPEVVGPPPPRAHVRWIGGGPHAGETFLHCALREAEEELGCQVEIASSAESIVELRPDPPIRAPLADDPAPLLVQRYDEGEVLVIYRARPLGRAVPTDVERLAWLPLEALDAVVMGIAAGGVAAHGIEIVGPPLEPDVVLFIGRLGAEYLLRRLRVDEAATRR